MSWPTPHARGDIREARACCCLLPGPSRYRSQPSWFPQATEVRHHAAHHPRWGPWRAGKGAPGGSAAAMGLPRRHAGGRSGWATGGGPPAFEGRPPAALRGCSMQPQEGPAGGRNGSSTGGAWEPTPWLLISLPVRSGTCGGCTRSTRQAAQQLLALRTLRWLGVLYPRRWPDAQAAQAPCRRCSVTRRRPQCCRCRRRRFCPVLPCSELCNHG